MSPLPQRDRFTEYAKKGAHFALRLVDDAPEQRVARALRTQAPVMAPGGPVVAFLTPRDWAVHVQTEAMIAQALRLRGANVRFITCGGELEICDRANTYEAPPMPCFTCRKYVHASIDAHGFEWLALHERWARDDPGDWPEIDRLSQSQLRDVTWKGLPLGALVDIPVRWFLMRSRLEDEPLAAMTTRRFLRSARRIARALTAVLDEVTPDVLVELNGLFLFESIAREIAIKRGIDVVTYERGFVTNSLLFHRREPDNLYEIGDVWDQWSGMLLTEAEEQQLDQYLDDRRIGRRTMDRYWSSERDETTGARRERGRRAILFTNLTWDSSVLGQEVAFPSILDWIDTAIELFAARPDHELVIRVHPAEVKLPGKQTREPIGMHLDERFPVLPDNVEVIAAEDSTSSYTLMDEADLALVFTSTTGLEMALRGKPVIVAARTHYRAKGFTLDCTDPASFEQMLDAALDDPRAVAPDLDLVRRYAYFFFFRAPVEVPGVEEHEIGLVRLTTRDLGDLAPGASESLDRICDGILRGGSFRPTLVDRR